MSSKSLVIGLIIGLLIGLPMGYFLPQIIQNLSNSTSNLYAGYTQVRVNMGASAFDSTVEEFGSYKYYFNYFPETITSGITSDACVYIHRQHVTPSTRFPATIGVTQTYYEIEFIVTEVQPEYCILMVKYTP